MRDGDHWPAGQAAQPTAHACHGRPPSSARHVSSKRPSAPEHEVEVRAQEGAEAALDHCQVPGQGLQPINQRGACRQTRGRRGKGRGRHEPHGRGRHERGGRAVLRAEKGVQARRVRSRCWQAGGQEYTSSPRFSPAANPSGSGLARVACPGLHVVVPGPVCPPPLPHPLTRAQWRQPARRSAVGGHACTQCPPLRRSNVQAAGRYTGTTR